MKKRYLKLAWLAAPAVVWGGVVLWAKLTPPPKGLGADNGSLSPCPDKPNCVCSEAADERHAIAPLSLHDTTTQSLDQLADIVAHMAGARVVARDENYLRAEFTSRLFRFVDDVEFYVPPDATSVHVRSASRLGHSDLGVNRQRVETIRQQYERDVATLGTDPPHAR